MPRLTIDNQTVEVPAGATLLDAARRIGLDIPALCHRDGCRPQNACMLCLVRDAATGRLVPSCSTPAADGQQIESETPEIRSLRRTGLELLLSNHLGDCSAPCEAACPLHLNVPEMLGQVAAGRMRQAMATIRREMALPAVLGYVCTHPCENACRRGQLDDAAAICRVQRHVAEADLLSHARTLPEMATSSGKRVAVVGSGPTGLAAAYHLRIAGHACTVFEAREQAGGRLRTEFTAAQLPPAVLDGEIALIARMGVEFRTATTVGTHVSVDELRRQFDALLITTGPGAGELDVPSDPGVFTAGRAVRPSLIVVRAMAEGKAIAAAIDLHLRGQSEATHRPFTVRAGRLKAEQLVQLGSLAGQAGRIAEGDPSDEDLIRQEAERCLHCDCGKRDGCRLRRYAAAYDASATRYGSVRRPLERHGRPGGLIYEPGKCILCGLCVEIATAAGEPLGLAFVGRGFDVRVDVPFGATLEEALTIAARRCAEACPSGALTYDHVEPARTTESS